jgi:hypothetical protein
MLLATCHNKPLGQFLPSLLEHRCFDSVCLLLSKHESSIHLCRIVSDVAYYITVAIIHPILHHKFPPYGLFPWSYKDVPSFKTHMKEPLLNSLASLASSLAFHVLLHQDSSELEDSSDKNACPVSMRPWVQSPVLPKGKKKKNRFIKGELRGQGKRVY